MARKAPALFAVSISLALAAPASGEEEEAKIRCKSSYESAQVLKREERFEAARAQLLVCKQTCPAALARECVGWDSEVAALMPTVRLAPRDAAGAPVTGVRVTVDGRALTAANGPLPIDPGTHVFRFETQSGPAVETRIAIHAGERERVVEVVVESPRAAPPPPSTARAAPRGSRTASFILGGIGGVAALTAGVLAIKGHADKSDLRSTCAPLCDDRDVDAIRTLWWVSAGVGAAGAIALGAAVVLWPRAGTDGARALTVGVAPNGLSLRGPIP